MLADLHFHSIFSDGVHTPKELVDIAKIKKMDVLSLSDHDALLGVEEITKYANMEGIMVIPGVELSSYNNGEPIHILGYFRSYETIPKFFKEFLNNVRIERYERMKQMTKNINDLYNLDIDFELIQKKHPYMLERPHLAIEMANKLNISLKEVFDNYLSNDSKGFIPSTKLPTKDAIDLIHKAGGLAILAHPYLYKKNNPFDLIEYGVDGIEVFYSPTDESLYKPYYDYAKEHNLLMTGGSDFHRENDYKHKPLGDVNYGSPFIEELLNKIRNMQ